MPSPESRRTISQSWYRLTGCPALMPALGLMGGIAFFNCLPQFWLPFVIACILGGSAGLIFKKAQLSILFFSLILGCGDAYLFRPTPMPAPLIPEGEARLGGVVRDYEEGDNCDRILLEVSSVMGADSIVHTGFKPFYCEISHNPSGTEHIGIGDEISLNCEDIKSQPASPEFMGDRDSRSYYRSKGITASAVSFRSEILVTGHHSTFTGYFRLLRQKLTDIIYGSPLNAETSFFLASVLLGDDTYFGSDEKDKFRSIGIAHVLALSGFHLGIIIMILSLAFYPLKVLKRRARLRFLLIIAGIWLYCCITGLLAPVVRAAVVASVFLLAKVLQRRTNPFNSLAVAALVLLLPCPQNLWSPGFQLSFLAVVSMTLFADRLNPFSHRRHPRLRKIAEYFTVPFSAVIGTAPLVIYYFHSFPLCFVLSNLLAVWLFPLILFGGVIILICGAFGFYPLWLCVSTDWLYDLMIRLGEALGAMPAGSIDNLYPPAASAIMFTLAVILAGLWLNRRHRLTGTAVIASLTVALTLSFSAGAEAATEEGILLHSGKSQVLIYRNDNNVRLYTDSKPQFMKRKLSWANRRAENYYKIYGLTPPDTIYSMDEAPAKYLPASPDTLSAPKSPAKNHKGHKSDKSDRSDRSHKSKKPSKTFAPPSRKYSPDEL